MRRKLRIDFIGGFGKRGKIKMFRILSNSVRKARKEDFFEGKRLSSMVLKQEGLITSIFLDLED